MQNINNFQYFLATHQTLFILLIVWSIVWKGFALWKAGKNKSNIWFVALLLINTLGLLEIIYLFAIKNKDEKSESTSTTVATDVKTETKVETVVEEKKEEIPTPVTEVKIEEAPVAEVKPEETNQEEIKAEEVKEEIKQEINQ